MESSIKKFKPYKKILELDVSLEDASRNVELPDDRKRKSKRKLPKASVSILNAGVETSASVTQDNLNATKCLKQNSKMPKLKGKVNEPTSDQIKMTRIIESKNNKENNRKGEAVVKDAQNSEVDECLIVLDSNANVKQSNSDSVNIIWNSPDRILNSNLHRNSEKSSPSAKRSLEFSTTSPKMKSKRFKSKVVDLTEQNVIPILKASCEERKNKDGKSERQKLLCNLLDKANTIQTVVDLSDVPVIEILDDSKSTSETNENVNNVNMVSNASKVTNDKVDLETGSQKSNDLPKISQTKVVRKSVNNNDTITIDDSIIIGETDGQTGSDIGIINNETRTKNNSSQGPIIVDLVRISAPMPSTASPVKFVGFESREQQKPFTSLIHPEVLSHQFGTLPDIIPLEFCGSKRKRKKEKRGSKHSDDGLGLSNKSRKIKKKASQSPGLEKLKKKRKRILSTLSTLSPSPREAEASSSSSGTTATVSSSAISGALSNASNRSTLTHDFLPLAQAGPSTSSAVWTIFNQPHVLNHLNFPRFINTQNSQGLIFNQPPPGTITAQTVYNVPPPVRPPVRQTSRPQLNDNNVYNPATSTGERTGLRPIVIDGSNVAFEYLKNPLTGLRFNSKGIEIVVDYFKRRGHEKIHVFIPSFRAFHCNTTNPEILERLQREGILHHTPSRKVNGCMQVAYDDRYIVQVATELDGVIVSNDRYRDIMEENAKWKSTIEKRLLMFNFVGEMLMFPQDPQGRGGPNLDTFLRF